VREAQDAASLADGAGEGGSVADGTAVADGTVVGIWLVAGGTDGDGSEGLGVDVLQPASRMARPMLRTRIRISL
jgi:hypothetical protein